MNVLFFVLDTLRAGRCGSYGYWRNTTPTLDRLAREGVLFEDCYCSGISTGNAFTCLHTGLPAVRHGYYCTPAAAVNVMNFDDTLPTLAEIVQCNTRHTTVAVDNLINFAGHMKQTVRGYEFYINPTRESGFPHPEYTAGRANERLLPWLRAHAGREPFFAFVHYWDTHHTPYQAPGFRDRFRQPRGSYAGLPVRRAPAGYDYVPDWGPVGRILWDISLRDKYKKPTALLEVDGGLSALEPARDAEGELSQDLYDCALAYMDDQIARVLDTLRETGVLDDTLLVVTADHGEGLGIHKSWGHGQLYQHVLHIPLILWRPGLLPQGRRIQGLTQHIDVAPTILELMGVTGPGKKALARIGDRSPVADYGRHDILDVQMAGRSLLPRITADAPAWDFVVTERRRTKKEPGLRSVTQPPWRYIEGTDGSRELYHFLDDPMEQVDLIAREPARADEMARRLREWLAGHLPEGRRDPILTAYGE
jgi:arylsulfatase A-like enzyme